MRKLEGCTRKREEHRKTACNITWYVHIICMTCIIWKESLQLVIGFGRRQRYCFREIIYLLFLLYYCINWLLPNAGLRIKYQLQESKTRFTTAVLVALSQTPFSTQLVIRAVCTQKLQLFRLQFVLFSKIIRINLCRKNSLNRKDSPKISFIQSPRYTLHHI